MTASRRKAVRAPISSARARRAWSAPLPARVAPIAAPCSAVALTPTVSVPSAPSSCTVASSAASSTAARSLSARSPFPSALPPKTPRIPVSSTNFAPPWRRTPPPPPTRRRALQPRRHRHRATTTLVKPSRTSSRSKWHILYWLRPPAAEVLAVSPYFLSRQLLDLQRLTLPNPFERSTQ